MTAGMSSVTEAVSHFPVARGPRLRSFFSVPGGVMMSPGRGRGGGVVDAGQLCHPLAAVLFPW